MDNINRKVNDILDSDPFTEIQKGSNKVFEEERQALAQCYAIVGFRKYLENAINLLVRDGFVNFSNIEILRIKQGRVLALKELLSQSKRAYETIEKKDATPKG